ncbi:MAG TPA: carboxypeptidase regulatory-like domain-containing protein, partial [Candidatus Angelobacter sp.]|nr:carboxypeptidase regulatory-like domain-containing protein [Candidatus Angelobacter sp.]
QFTFNLRLSKTFGIGPKLEAGNQPRQGPRGDGGSRGGRSRPIGLGPRGPGGPMGPATNQRYNLTFSINARNIFNDVNPAPPVGNLSSALFGQSTSLASGNLFNTQSANRRVDLQVMFSF